MEFNSVLLSTAYFGPIQYFTKFCKYNRVIIESDEHFQKQSYRNRCRIYGANGIQSLSVPIVKEHGKKIKIRDIRISYDTDWIKLHKKSIESAYGSAPFYEFYHEEIFELFEPRPDLLLEFNQKITLKILSILDHKPEIELTGHFIAEPLINDYRKIIHPKKDIAIDKEYRAAEYYQIFNDRLGFIANLSILDLLFNAGTETMEILNKSII